MTCPSLSLVKKKNVVFKSLLSDVGIATQLFFDYCLHIIFFHPFTFVVSLNLKCVSCRHYIVGSCFSSVLLVSAVNQKCVSCRQHIVGSCFLSVLLVSAV